ncbi:MAG: PTS sugar transporter subunit IIA [Planctomycetota bacterium]|nr:PTS sugar transporter subunit IIA [Planctomycetota bacterium]
MNILRFLQPECILLDLQTVLPEPVEDENESQRERRLVATKEAILQELCDLFDRSGQISNPTKFYKDMVNRERKATTAIAPRIAIPHVRTMQAKGFVMAMARSRTGLPFNSLDGTNTNLFFCLAAPPYEDKMYLKVYREFAEMIQNEWVVDAFMDAESEQDVLNVLRGFVAQ